MTYPRIIAFLLAFMVCSGALAADLFTIDGIKVSSSGANAKQAKDAATLAGQREAFTKLLERIASNQTTPPDISPENLAEMVQGIEVNDEKVTATYYSATLNISFNRSFVDNFLKNKNINFTSTKSAPIIIIPVLLGDEDKFTFEGSNPWRNGITSVTKANHVLSITVLPSLRGVDKTKITMDIGSLDQGTKDDLLKIGQSYNAEKLILAVASRDAGNAENLTVRMQDLKDPQGEIREITVIGADLQAEEDSFTRAAKNVTSILEEQWVKGKNEDNSTELSVMTLKAPISSLDAWESTHKKLKNLGFLKTVNVKSINVKYALVEVSFKDTPEGFASKMGQAGFVVEKKGDDIVLYIR